jgi:tRNA(Ile)-lysidine synthase
MNPARKQSLESCIRATMQCHGMAAEGESILVAVSGGADSIALLHILCALGHAVEVAHFDHQTRDGASTADAQFVRGVAEGLGIPFHVESRPIAQEAATLGVSFEMHARDARYAFFERTARARGCVVIATGHHRGDQAETVLLRLLRGAGPSGLAGIPPVRRLGELRVVRPCLDVSKAEIEDWLREHGLPWREDISNNASDFLRNRVRNELIPVLCREYNPGIAEALCRLADGLRVESDFVEAQACAVFDILVTDDGLRLDRKQFACLHEALQRRTVLEWGWRHGVVCSHDRVVGAVRFIAKEAVGQRFSFGNGWDLYNGRVHTELIPSEPDLNPEERTRLAVPGLTMAFGRRFEVSFLEALPPVPLAEYASSERQVFDADAAGEELWLRQRIPGDRFHPLGMNGSKAVKDYFVDAGIPAPHRPALPLLESGGRILWVVGHAVSADTAITAASRRFLQIEVTPCD